MPVDILDENINKENSTSMIEIAKLEKKARLIRKSILLTAKRTGGRGSHLGGTMSCVDILVALYYGDFLNIRPHEPMWNNRDRVLIGKGHAHLALYHIWSDIGYFNKEKISEYGVNGGSLGVQLDNRIPGSEYNTGSLGHVIGIGTGICLSSKIDRNNFRVITLIGDGECESGSIWESVAFAAEQKINNLITIIDVNRLSELKQSSDDSDKILSKKFESFGWDSIIVNGHSFMDLNRAFDNFGQSSKPLAIIANTIKGKGVSFMENNVEWHHKAPKPEQFEIALKEYE